MEEREGDDSGTSEEEIIVDPEKFRRHPRYEGVYVDNLGRFWKLGELGIPERTYDSWERREVNLELQPPDRRESATRVDRELVVRMVHHLRQEGIDPFDEVKRIDMTDAIRACAPKEETPWYRLRHLWRSGLVERRGYRGPNDARARNIWWRVKL